MSGNEWFETDTPKSGFKPKYAFGGLMFWLLDKVALMLISGGIFLSWWALDSSEVYGLLPRLGVALPGAAVAFAGIILGMIATIGDAVLDTANNTAEAVHILLDREG